MKPLKILPEGSYIKGIDFSSEIQHNLFVDVLFTNLNKDEVNILLLSEPDVISGLVKSLPNLYQNFDVILTHNEEVLNKYENAKLFIFNSIWASNKDYSPKEFSVSTIVGNKLWTKQQVMRQELWAVQEEIKNRKFFASSVGPPREHFGNPSIGDNKDELFKSQFHIAIENCCIKNFFTEKILDCFISKTVPIYCGCVNIGDFFNENGIIKFNNIKECINICNSLKDDDYEKFLPYIEENYNKALEYLDWQKRIRNKLIEIDIKSK